MTEAVAFSEVSAVRAADGGFVADLHPDWTIAGRPNGGYLLAVVARAAASLTTHEHPLAASATYLHAPLPGPVLVTAEILREGRSAAQLRARLMQQETVCLEALLIFGRLTPGSGAFWRAADAGAPQGERGSGLRLSNADPDRLPVPIMDQIDLRLDPERAGFLHDGPSGRGELSGWLALLRGEDFDPFSLLFAVDALPPATRDVEPTGWVPTLELTAYVRALPAPGPVRVRQRASVIDGGRVDEACSVWDATGRLVAQATQLAAIRLG